ncbi:YtxH domain-containing protein [Candidatus Peregrinibacteria bacterium]|nr:YtxH domain-containing protein [Candidatus Peregrinibacteria bacterium]
MGDNDKKKILDKVLMGAVIGGAIGSVIGAAIAPKEGKETRKDIADVTKKAIKTSSGIFRRIKNFFHKEKDGEE